MPCMSLSDNETVCFESGINNGENYPLLFQEYKFCELVY